MKKMRILYLMTLSALYINHASCCFVLYALLMYSTPCFLSKDFYGYDPMCLINRYGCNCWTGIPRTIFSQLRSCTDSGHPGSVVGNDSRVFKLESDRGRKGREHKLTTQVE